MANLAAVGTYCPRCDADVECVETTTLGDVEQRYIQAGPCPTPGCGTTCPICRRPIGDVHSGVCMPIVEAKLVDKVHVSREDCLGALDTSAS